MSSGVPLGESTQLQIIIPRKGDTNWAESIKQNCFQKIVEHNHDGSGNGVKIKVQNLDGINIDDIQDGEYLRWDATLRKFVPDEVTVDVTDGTAETTKTAFQVYNANATTKDLTDNDGTSTNATVTSTELNSSTAIDTRQTALDTTTGKYVVQRSGVYELEVNALLTNLDSDVEARIYFRKKNVYGQHETVYSRKFRFDELEPIGTIKAFGHKRNPNLGSGRETWIKCDGSVVSQDYPLLRTYLGTYSSKGDFTTPDLTGTHAYLKGVDHTATDILGTQDDTTSADGLSISHTLGTGDQSASHTHTYSDIFDSDNSAGALQPHMRNYFNDTSLTVIEFSGGSGDPLPSQTGGDQEGGSNDGLNRKMRTQNTSTSSDTSHSHSITGDITLNGATETSPNSTKVVYWIKAAHAPKFIATSVLVQLDKDEEIYPILAAERGTAINAEPVKLDFNNDGEGFLFRGTRLM